MFIGVVNRSLADSNAADHRKAYSNTDNDHSSYSPGEVLCLTLRPSCLLLAAFWKLESSPFKNCFCYYNRWEAIWQIWLSQTHEIRRLPETQEFLHLPPGDNVSVRRKVVQNTVLCHTFLGRPLIPVSTAPLFMPLVQ